MCIERPGFMSVRVNSFPWLISPECAASSARNNAYNSFYIAHVMEFRRSIHGISVESPEPQGKHIVLTDFSCLILLHIVKRIKDRNTSILEGIYFSGWH